MGSFKLRVVISDSDVKKMCLPSRPDSVEILKGIIKNDTNIESKSFNIQYADPDFGGNWVNLSEISELPADFASVKIVQLPEPPDVSFESSYSLSSDSTNSTHDTMSVSSNDDLQSLDTKLRQGSWPEVFQLPKLGPELNLIFETGNAKFNSNHEQLTLRKDVKSQFLDAIANEIWQYKAYPTHMEYVEVAQAILQKYPCLKEKGSATGYDGMVCSLKFKMGNMRAKLRKLDCVEMKINSRKRSNPGTTSTPNPKVKKPKRAELNYLPELPKGEDNSSMEIQRGTLQTEMQKKNKDMEKIHSRMRLTFAYRRRELVADAPPVKDTLERWPGLESELAAEFSRLANISLEARFFSSLDEHTDRMLKLLRERGGASLHRIQTELQSLEDIDAKRTAVLRCLPLYFKEELFYKDCENIPDDADITVGEKQKIVIFGDAQKRMCIIIEENRVLDNLTSFPKAVALFFSIHYCLDLKYGTGQQRTMEFIQKVLFNLNGKKLSPKVQSLKNKLMA